MSRAREAFDALRTVLAEERSAIRRLDGNVIGEMARQKEHWAQVLTSLPRTELAGMASEVESLRTELRRNGILLAHARACLKSVVEIARGHIAGESTRLLRAKV